MRLKRYPYHDPSVQVATLSTCIVFLILAWYLLKMSIDKTFCLREHVYSRYPVGVIVSHWGLVTSVRVRCFLATIILRFLGGVARAPVVPLVDGGRPKGFSCYRKNSCSKTRQTWLKLEPRLFCCDNSGFGLVYGRRKYHTQLDQLSRTLYC